MPAVRLLIAFALAGLYPGTALSAQDLTIEERLAVGGTGIFCFRQPCPWRAIVHLDDPDGDGFRPLWEGEHLPELVATPQDRARIEAAWDAMECLEIRGMFAHGRLEIDHIVGTCR